MSTMRRQRILWLLDSFGMGGAESLVLPFARSLDRESFELIVAGISGGVNADRIRETGTRVVDLGAHSLRDVSAFRRLLALVREEQIDVMHAHLTYATIWSAIASRLTRVPAVATLHVSPIATQALHPSLRHRLLTSARDTLMKRIANRWTHTVVTVSDALRQEYVQSGLRASKTRVIHNGIELDRFRRPKADVRQRLESEFSIPPGAPIAVTVSVLRPKKGIEVLVDAVREVEDAIFLIIGDGPEKESWMELAHQKGVADRIRWAGYRTDVDALLAGADLFVHPSLDDAFPTVLLEAMAAGLPVVASRVGGIPEIVTDEENGLLVPPGNAKVLAIAIARLLRNETERNRMQQGAVRAADQFSARAWIDRLMSLYREVSLDRVRHEQSIPVRA
jgi:glycosyltransferase involved in cell wall biosynthesis